MRARARRLSFLALTAALSLPGAAPLRADTPGAPPARPAALTAPTQAAVAPAQSAAPKLGPVTNAPLPRFVSMRADEGNARRGPGRSYRIDWIFKQRHMPLQVTAEYQHWRRVEDKDGQGGWMHYALLSGTRYALMERETTLRRNPSEDADAAAIYEAGVIARILECTPNWCRLRSQGQRGWAPKSTFWGAAAGEVFD